MLCFRYPSVSSKDEYPFPVGEPTIIMNPTTLETISCKEGNCFLGKTKIYGLAQVSILAPLNLHIPFLPFRVQERSICALCRTCAETMNHDLCSHTQRERAFVST